MPERFAPVGALAIPEQAAGRAPATAIPAGSYVLVGQLREPNGAATTIDPPGSALGAGRSRSRSRVPKPSRRAAGTRPAPGWT